MPENRSKTFGQLNEHPVIVKIPRRIGARSAPVTLGSPGVNNRVTITINGEGQGKGKWQPVEFFTDTIPIAAPGINSVTVNR